VHVIASTHGAAFVALADGGSVAGGLAWEPVDYEFEGVATAPGGTADIAAARVAAGDNFEVSLSPDLPAGLNAARQLFWMQHAHPQAWQRTRCLLPYPQYWAWLLSGVACIEVSSLGCHTHLWNPARADFSGVAQKLGWAGLFAPLRKAWDVIGRVSPAVATDWGLPASCQVHVGVHDSNACLARYLDGLAPSAGPAAALTLVSSGTWTVMMAPGAPAESLVAEQDMLGNVDVTGRMTPTARFMGGREFAAILDGADAQAASAQPLARLMESRIFAMPAFAQAGGPFAGRIGHIQRQGQRLAGTPSEHLDEAERATLAATYCAQMTAWLVQRLWAGHVDGDARVIVEGPLASNALYMQVLQAILPGVTCLASCDGLEGTARGAWLLTRWGDASVKTSLKAVTACMPMGLQAYHAQWLQALSAG
jgi:sugar (pentulose or hexulose) kinase